MQTEAPSRRSQGRLSRDDQRRLGDILQRVYDDVIKQGVPDRFRELLQELEQGDADTQAASAPKPSSSQAEMNHQDSAEQRATPDRGSGAGGLADPDNRGPHS